MTDHRRQFRAIKGTRDILPPDSALWNWFEQTARDVFESYNFRDIRTPAFEDTNLFARSVGEDTDIVHKEMYSIGDSLSSNLSFARWMLSKSHETFVRTHDAKPFWESVDSFLKACDEAFASEEIGRKGDDDALRKSKRYDPRAKTAQKTLKTPLVKYFRWPTPLDFTD
jgi:hypothetical protein